MVTIWKTVKANSWVREISRQLSKLPQLLEQRRNRCQTQSTLRICKVQTVPMATLSHRPHKAKIANRSQSSLTITEVALRTASKIINQTPQPFTQ